MNALFNKERWGDLRVATRTVLSIFCWLTCFFPPCRKMRACNHDMFQLPSGILGKSWFWFPCQLRPEVSEVSQLFAHEAHSWEPGSWGGARVWAVGQVRSAGAVESETPTPGSAPWAWASVSPSSKWMGWYQSRWLRWCVLMMFCCLRAVAAAGWPAPVSVAGAGRVKETTEGVHEVVDGTTPTPLQSLGH